MNNFTIKSPHEINAERWVVWKHSTAVLFFQISLLRDLHLSAIYGGIITKSKGYDLWHNINKI